MGMKGCLAHCTLSQAVLSFLFLVFQIFLWMHSTAPFVHAIFSTFPLQLSNCKSPTCPQKQKP